ncbi:magnesium transporter CorA family protein [Candidatus Uhrbacteria bacterium]|nr:magnesium transporter CorA family protein [Candidatus Uhrbacteria bacterium]
MLTIYYKNIKENTLRVLEEFKVGSWIHVESPSEAEIKEITTRYNLDEGILRDATDFYEVPRIEVEQTVTYIFTRYPISKNDRIFTAPLLIIVAEDFFMTITQRRFNLIDRFTAGEIDFFTTQKTKLFLQLFFQIYTSYNQFLSNISRDIRRTRVQVENINNKDIVQFIVFEEVLNDFLSALIPTRASLRNLLSGKFLKLYKDDEDLVEDLFLNKGQLIEMCTANLRTIVNIREAYSAIMTHDLNKVIKLLTALTIIFSVPTMVASLYGMNVILPFSQSPFAFVGVVIFIILISVALVGVFIKNKWL